jgi:hypothetical protein
MRAAAPYPASPPPPPPSAKVGVYEPHQTAAAGGCRGSSQSIVKSMRWPPNHEPRSAHPSQGGSLARVPSHHPHSRRLQPVLLRPHTRTHTRTQTFTTLERRVTSQRTCPPPSRSQSQQRPALARLHSGCSREGRHRPVAGGARQGGSGGKSLEKEGRRRQELRERRGTHGAVEQHDGGAVDEGGG